MRATYVAPTITREGTVAELTAGGGKSSSIDSTYYTSPNGQGYYGTNPSA